ncbi:NUDIX domain-containing protein [Candidatus Omnitrophota bacterium]
MIKFRKDYNLKIISLIVSIVFFCSSTLYSYPNSKDTLRPPLSTADSSVSRGADGGFITRAQHVLMRLWLEHNDARREENRERDLESQCAKEGRLLPRDIFGVDATEEPVKRQYIKDELVLNGFKPEIYIVQGLAEGTGVRGHWALRDGVIYVDKGWFDSEGESSIWHELDELISIRIAAINEGMSFEEMVRWLDEEGDSTEVKRLLEGAHKSAHALPDEESELVADIGPSEHQKEQAGQPRPVRGAAKGLTGEQQEDFARRIVEKGGGVFEGFFIGTVVFRDPQTGGRLMLTPRELSLRNVKKAIKEHRRQVDSGTKPDKGSPPSVFAFLSDGQTRTKKVIVENLKPAVTSIKTIEPDLYFLRDAGLLDIKERATETGESTYALKSELLQNPALITGIQQILDEEFTVIAEGFGNRERIIGAIKALVEGTASTQASKTQEIVSQAARKLASQLEKEDLDFLDSEPSLVATLLGAKCGYYSILREPQKIKAIITKPSFAEFGLNVLPIHDAKLGEVMDYFIYDPVQVVKMMKGYQRELLALPGITTLLSRLVVNSAEGDIHALEELMKKVVVTEKTEGAEESDVKGVLLGVLTGIPLEDSIFDVYELLPGYRGRASETIAGIFVVESRHFNQPHSVNPYYTKSPYGKFAKEVIPMWDIAVDHWGAIVSEGRYREKVEPIYYGPGTALYDGFDHKRDISRDGQQRNIELILSASPIEASLDHSNVRVFNLGSGARPLTSFGKYTVVNFDPDFSRAEDIEWQAHEEAEKIGAEFQRGEITDIVEKCSVAIWYDLVMFIIKYAEHTSIWRDTEGDTRSREVQVFHESLRHTWDLIEEGGYFIIAGRHFPKRWPAQAYEAITALGFNVSEVHVVGESIDRAEAIILRKGPPAFEKVASKKESMSLRVAAFEKLARESGWYSPLDFSTGMSRNYDKEEVSVARFYILVDQSLIESIEDRPVKACFHGGTREEIEGFIEAWTLRAPGIPMQVVVTNLLQEIDSVRRDIEESGLHTRYPNCKITIVPLDLRSKEGINAFNGMFGPFDIVTAEIGAGIRGIKDHVSIFKELISGQSLMPGGVFLSRVLWEMIPVINSSLAMDLGLIPEEKYSVGWYKRPLKDTSAPEDNVYVTKEIRGHEVIIAEMPESLAKEKSIEYSANPTASLFADEIDPRFEFIDIIEIDEDGNEQVVGRALRISGDLDLIHEKGLLHRIAIAFVFSPDGKFVISRRAHNRSEPLTLALFGGHVSSGSDYKATIEREIVEEFGFPKGWVLQGELRAIGKEGEFEYGRGSKNHQRAANYIYTFSNEEYRMVKQTQADDQAEKKKGTRKDFEAKLETKQAEGDGKGEIWETHMFSMEQIITPKEDEHGPYVEVEEEFSDSKELTRARFLDFLTSPVLDNPEIVKQLRRTADILTASTVVEVTPVLFNGTRLFKEDVLTDEEGLREVEAQIEQLDSDEVPVILIYSEAQRAEIAKRIQVSNKVVYIVIDELGDEPRLEFIGMLGLYEHQLRLPPDALEIYQQAKKHLDKV